MTQNVSEVVPPVSPVFVGIDVAKEKLDLARSDNRQLLSVPNNEKGIGQIIESLKGAAISCIVIEATGGYERLLVNMLLDARLPAGFVIWRWVWASSPRAIRSTRLCCASSPAWPSLAWRKSSQPTRWSWTR
jgi:hypothetical protein